MHQTLPATPTDRTVQADGVTIHARDWGDPGARPVVLLHGLSSNARIWDGVASALVEAGLRVVAIDQRGHGESGQPDSGYDFATVTGDLERVLEAMGISGPLLVGHSWGANVALEYSAGRPGAVSGLALVDGAFNDVAALGPDRDAVRELLAPPRFAVPLTTWLDGAERWLPPGVDPRAGWVRDFLRAGVEVDADGIASARFRYDHHLQVIDALYDQRPSLLLASVTCPVLLCPAGGQRAAAKRAAIDLATRAAPGARVTWFEDAMHDIPLQRPAELAAALAAFAAGEAGRG